MSTYSTVNISAQADETVTYVFDSVTLPGAYTAAMQARRKPDSDLISDFTLSETGGVFTATSDSTFNPGIYLYDLIVKDTAAGTFGTKFRGTIEIL